MSLLTDLDAFFTEHGRCGELDAGVEGPIVWIACDCGGAWRVGSRKVSVPGRLDSSREGAGDGDQRRIGVLEGADDCVVIGAGVRLPPNRLVLFEALVNAIHRAAPGVAIAFNTRPEDTGAAAARWI